MCKLLFVVFWLCVRSCVCVLPHWSYGVMVSTLDFESSDPGSSPGRTSFLLVAYCVEVLRWVASRLSVG